MGAQTWRNLTKKACEARDFDTLARQIERCEKHDEIGHAERFDVLQHAVQHGDISVLEYLLRNGRFETDIPENPYQHRGLGFMAVLCKRLDIYDALIRHGYDVEQEIDRDPEYSAPAAAAMHDDAEIADRLLTGKLPKFSPRRNDWLTAYTDALEIAVAHHNPVPTFYLAARPDLFEDETGSEFLEKVTEEAAEKATPDVIEALCAGARFSEALRPEHLDKALAALVRKAAKTRKTPSAEQRENRDRKLDKLLAEGASPFGENDPNLDRTPLNEACKARDGYILRQFAAHGYPATDPRNGPNGPAAAMDHALHFGQPDTLDALLEQGVALEAAGDPINKALNGRYAQVMADHVQRLVETRHTGRRNDAAAAENTSVRTDPKPF